MDAADVEGRAELARFLRRAAFQADAERLLAVAREEGATGSALRARQAEVERGFRG